MDTWLIIITIIGGIWVLGFLLAVSTFIYTWVEERKLEWNLLLIGLLFPIMLLCWICYTGSIYFSIIKGNGGLIEHIRFVKQRKREDKEYRRIEEAYKNGEISREELPRNLDGIYRFELKGELLSCDWRELVYIENQYNEVLNDFFRRHPMITFKHNIRVIYLPTEIKRLASHDIIKYQVPTTEEPVIEAISIKPEDLLNELYYTDDAVNLHHGLMSCSGWSYNHGAEYLNGRYYVLEEGSDEDVLAQIESIAKTVYGNNTGGLNCAVNRPSLDKEPTEDFADEQFGWEINNLLEEVKERVDRLEQCGFSRKLLMKMIIEKPKLSRLVVTKDMRIILPDYNNIEIKMEPINKAVFILFLRHPEGVVFKELPDYRKELAEIYQKIKPLGLNERALQSIEDVTNPLLNSINEKCARIRGAFVSQFDEDLAQYYYIFGPRGEAKKILLSRDLVVWE